MKTVVFCSFPDYAGNSRSLYNYMQKKNNNHLNLVWVVTDDNMYNKLKNQEIKVVKEGTTQMKQIMKKADVVFTTHANLIDYKEQNSNLLYIELWHGVGPKNTGYLINNMSESDANWMEKFIKKVDYVVVPTDFWRIVFVSFFGLNPYRVLNLGLPLIDSILNAKGKDNLEKVLNCDISKYNKIIYYMPTVRSGTSRNEKISINTKNIFNIQEYSENQLIDFLKKNNYLLCIKYHPSEKIKFERVDCDNIKYILEEEIQKYELDTNMLLNASDLLISDYSSLGFHYLVLEKPVIYLQNDLKQYSSKRGIVFDNQEFWTDNNTAIDINGLIKKIESDLKNPDLDRIIKRKKLLFGNIKNGGCKKIYDAIFTEDGQIKLSSIINEEEKLKVEKEQTIEDNRKLQSINESYFLELAAIKHSRSYKLTQKIKRILRRK